jgi:hypothetical protein
VLNETLLGRQAPPSQLAVRDHSLFDQVLGAARRHPEKTGDGLGPLQEVAGDDGNVFLR